MDTIVPEKGTAMAYGCGVGFSLFRGAGRPWRSQGDWDLMTAEVGDERALDDFVAAAARKQWQVWLRGHSTTEGGPVPPPCKPGGIL